MIFEGVIKERSAGESRRHQKEEEGGCPLRGGESLLFVKRDRSRRVVRERLICEKCQKKTAKPVNGVNKGESSNPPQAPVKGKRNTESPSEYSGRRWSH